MLYNQADQADIAKEASLVICDTVCIQFVYIYVPLKWVVT